MPVIGSCNKQLIKSSLSGTDILKWFYLQYVENFQVLFSADILRIDLDGTLGQTILFPFCFRVESLSTTFLIIFFWL